MTGPAAAGGLIASAPEGFDDLASERQLVVDVYFGGRKLGDARAAVRPGSLTFERPEQVAAMIPEVAKLPELVSALGGPLPSNPALVCGPTRHDGCGVLQPERAGVILDEERFRVEIFVHSNLLAKSTLSEPVYLADPEPEPALVSLLGGTFSGATRRSETWHLQNRSIASIGNLRLRSDSSLSSGVGVAFDNLSLEADRKDWRYVGGLFWAPGTDLIGRRKIFGLGLATQIDTRQDKMVLAGTPLALFLHQAAKVDVLIDGRTVSSRIYPAGNRVIDTTVLPNGSYDVVLRIQEDGRPLREERQFFSKGTLMAPLGRPLLSAFAGILPRSGKGISFKSRALFYEAAAAYRLSRPWGVDAKLLGTQDKAILEAGAIFHTRFAQFRAAALLSTSVDHGIVLRASSVTRGPLSFSLDLRKVHSGDGRALLPLSGSQGTFSDDPDSGFSDRGSFTQGLSIFGYRLGQANFRLTGLYRRHGSDHSTYNVGLSVEAPVIRSDRWDLLLQADGRKTDRDFATFLGVRVMANRGAFAFSGSSGISHRSDRRSTRLIGQAQAAWYKQLADHSQLSADAAIGRDEDGSYARASAFARTARFNARLDALHQFAGHGGGTQYAATLDSGLVVTRGRFALAGRELNDTAVMVSVTGGDSGQEFEVLVDEVVRGTVANGDRLALFLQPYESYDVRLRPRGGFFANFDTASRQISLFPGSVAGLEWKFRPLLVMFGRAVGLDGKPFAQAEIAGPHGLGRTDTEGYFQVETSIGDQLRLSDGKGRACMIAVPHARPSDGYYSAGDVLCR